jgi:hypothetical protein
MSGVVRSPQPSQHGGARMTNRRIDKIVGTTPQPGSGILHPFRTRDLEHLDPSGEATIPVPAGWTVAVTVVEGKASSSDSETLEPGDTVVFADDGDSVHISSVMNTPEEIDTAFADYRAGRMGTLSSSR